jgi:hypothetical protein
VLIKKPKPDKPFRLSEIKICPVEVYFKLTKKASGGDFEMPPVK